LASAPAAGLAARSPRKLYGISGTMSDRCRWMLHELGISYEYVEVTVAELQSGKYSAMTPDNKTPFFVDGEIKIWETGAICSYLLRTAAIAGDTHLSAGWTQEQRARHHCLSFYCVDLDRKYLGLFFQAYDKTRANGDKAWRTKIAPYLLEDLGTNTYFNGNAFSATDIYVGYLLHIAHQLNLLNDYPAMQAYYEQVSSRPGFLAATTNTPGTAIPMDFDVKEWLESIKMGEYAASFAKHGYTTEGACQELDDSDLDALGVKLAGHRKIIKSASKNVGSVYGGEEAAEDA